MSKKILVTGASGTFGSLTVKKLLDEGHTVVASVRDPAGRNKPCAIELNAVGAHIVEIDVTHNISVNQGVEQAIERIGGLDVVINNAGIGAFGIQETFTDSDWQNLFDVNVFGVQRVNRAVLPYMRAHNSGLLVHVSSLIGRMVLPFWGPYSASKWALEALAETFRIELSKYGIDSCVIEPGPYPTGFFNQLVAASDISRNESYGDFAGEARSFFNDFGHALNAHTEQNAQNVADAIARIVNTAAGDRSFRTVVDNMGMGDYIQKYNDQHQQFTSEIFHAFGIQKMLALQVEGAT